MARSAKHKNARKATTAAYQASQPLFNALRHGVDDITKQRADLVIARDLVQTVHVKLDGAKVGTRDRYVDCAVKSWRSAIEMYKEIFDELAALSAPEPGKDALYGYESFVAMAESANLIREETNLYQTREERKRLEVDNDKDQHEEDSDGDTSDTNAEAKKTTKEAPRTSTPLAILNGNGKRPAASDPSPITLDQPRPSAKKRKAEPLSPNATSGSVEKQEKLHQKRKADMASKVEQTAPKIEQSNKEPASKPQSDRTFTNLGSGSSSTQPKVDFEDVSVEVERRLRGKEEKKQKKKAEKKRKRPSGDSSELVPTELAVEKPQKKKAKSEAKAEFHVNGGGAEDVMSKTARKKQKRRLEMEERNGNKKVKTEKE